MESEKISEQIIKEANNVPSIAKYWLRYINLSNSILILYIKNSKVFEQLGDLLNFKANITFYLVTSYKTWFF